MVSGGDKTSVYSLASTVFRYSKHKFNVQYDIVTDFIHKLDSGQGLLLRDMYYKPRALVNPANKPKRRSPKKLDRSAGKGKRESSKGKSSDKSEGSGIVGKMMKLYGVM